VRDLGPENVRYAGPQLGKKVIQVGNISLALDHN
jgi:hypothetical protein